MYIRKAINKINRYLHKPSFSSTDITIGKNVHFGKNVVFNCRKVKIGDGCIFMDNVKIDSTEFSIGDYGTIYQNCFFPGPGKLSIGHNFWLGNNSIIDAQGNTLIGNNVGIGAHSQLWGHIKYGDLMYGCQHNSMKHLSIGNDVWLVGHNLVSPVKIEDRSMALLGSLITKDMFKDKTYGGSPAKDLTQKFGSQFVITSVKERQVFFDKKISQFCAQRKIKYADFFNTLTSDSDLVIPGKTNFNLLNRTYTKEGTSIEMEFLRYLLPDVKFIPSK